MRDVKLQTEAKLKIDRFFLSVSIWAQQSCCLRADPATMIVDCPALILFVFETVIAAPWPILVSPAAFLDESSALSRCASHAFACLVYAA